MEVIQNAVGAQGEQKLTPKCLLCVRSFAHVTSDHGAKYYHQSPAGARTFQHIGKVADLM